MLGALILIAAFADQGRIRCRFVRRYQDWLPAGIQFFLGALFSSYVIFYLQSASLTRSSLYLALLLVLLVSNEFLHKRLVSLYLLFALYYLAVCSFFIFFIPILTRRIGFWYFFAGGLCSLVVVAAMLRFLRRRGVLRQARVYAGALGMVGGLFLLMNVFYLQRWIPPVPLALRYGGIFHYAGKAGQGAYRLVYEPAPWHQPWRRAAADFHFAPGDTVYCFAAVFAPTELRGRVYHVWQYYDPREKRWVVTDRKPYTIEGGRYLGFRAPTFKKNVHPGRWRVDVQTEEAHTIGRIPFEIVPVERHVGGLRERLYY